MIKVLLGMACVIGAGCGEDESLCNPSLESVLLVTVASPEDLEVDRVTAEQAHKSECGDHGETDTSYACFEQGSGEYTIRVHSGSRVWTRKVQVRLNECNKVDEVVRVDVILTEESADSE